MWSHYALMLKITAVNMMMAVPALPLPSPSNWCNFLHNPCTLHQDLRFLQTTFLSLACFRNNNIWTEKVVIMENNNVLSLTIGTIKLE